MAKKLLSSNANISHAVGFGHTPIITRYRVLKTFGKVRKARTRPPLNQKHIGKRLAWCKKYRKLYFGQIIWVDEMRK